MDVLVIDPIHNVFDDGPDGRSGNDNNAMLFLLRERVERLREAVNLETGIILIHKTKKISKNRSRKIRFWRCLIPVVCVAITHQNAAVPDGRKPNRPCVLAFELRNGARA